MPSDDQYVERTPDLVARIRAMREAAEKEMNRFTRVADYDVRRVVGHGPKPSPIFAETLVPVAPGERTKKRAKPSASDQTSIKFVPAPEETDDDREDV